MFSQHVAKNVRTFGLEKKLKSKTEKKKSKYIEKHQNPHAVFNRKKYVEK